MPRYFFHLRDGLEISYDREGQDLPSPDVALAHAMQAARHTMAKAILEGERLGLTRTFQVEDEHGNTVREVPFRDAVVLDRVSEGPRSS
jgi:hypothetical protein